MAVPWLLAAGGSIMVMPVAGCAASSSVSMVGVKDCASGSSGSCTMALTSSPALVVCAPVFSFERRFGTEKLLRSVRKGRGPVLRRKIAVVCLEVLAIWAIVYLRQWNETLDYIGPASLDAPIQNIALLSRSSLRVTLKQFLILVFALRLLGMLTVGLLVSWLSSRAKGWEQAVLAGTGLLILPALLYYFDRAWAGNLSVLPILTGVEPLIPGPTQRGNMVRLLVWSAAAALLFGSACRSWRGKMKKIGKGDSF